MSIKLNKIINNTIIFFLLFALINSLPKFEELIQKKWDETSLFDYLKLKFLSPGKPENLKNLHYIIADPNEYLKKVNLKETKKNLELLYKEFNVTTFIYIISAIEKNKDLNYKLKDFDSKIYSEIYKNNPDFDQYSTISSIFRVEDKKLHIRLGSTCRDVLYDAEALTILKKRKNDLEKKNFEKLLNLFTKELLGKYRQNFKLIKHNNSYFTFKKFAILIFFIAILIILSTLIYCIFCNKENYYSKKMTKRDSFEIDINSKKENKIEEFIEAHKNENIENIMENTCLICLENYVQGNDFKNNVITTSSDEEDSNNNDKNNNDNKVTDGNIYISCGHIFHINCISDWFKIEKKCPICGAEYEFYEDGDGDGEIKSNENKLNIKNFILNKDWEYENNNILANNINNFIRIQKMANNTDINEDFSREILNNYEDKKNVFKSLNEN